MDLTLKINLPRIFKPRPSVSSLSLVQVRRQINRVTQYQADLTKCAIQSGAATSIAYLIQSPGSRCAGFVFTGILAVALSGVGFAERKKRRLRQALESKQKQMF
jgi:hypothetical protein